MDRIEQLEKQIENIWNELASVDQLRLRFSNLESWISININRANIVKPCQSKPVIGEPQSLTPGASEMIRVSPNAKDVTSTTRIQPQPLPIVAKGLAEAEPKGQVTQGDKEAGQILVQPQCISRPQLSPVPQIIATSSGNETKTVTTKFIPQKASTTVMGLASSSTSISVPLNEKSAYCIPKKAVSPEITSADTSSPIPGLKNARIASIIKSHRGVTAEFETDTSAVSLGTSVSTGTNTNGISSTTPTKTSNDSVYCKKCSIHFSSLKIYTLHKSKVHLKFVCRFCPNNKRFEEQPALYQHINDVHRKPKLSQKKERIAGGKGNTIYQLGKVPAQKNIFATPNLHPQTKSSATSTFNKAKCNDGNHLKNKSTAHGITTCCQQCQKTFQHSKHLKQHLYTHQERDVAHSAAPQQPPAWQCHIDVNGNYIAKSVV